MQDEREATHDEPVEKSGPTGDGVPQASGGASRLAETVAAGDGAALDPEAEQELWAGRTHWKHYAGRLACWLACNVLVVVLLFQLAGYWEPMTGGHAFWVALGILLVSGAVVVGRVLLVILGVRYRLTSQRLFVERGILSRTVDQTELIRVDDVRLHKSLLNRVFGLGSVAIISTDATDREIVIAGIAEPERVAEAIRTRMRTLRRKSLFIENL